ncbi:MAG: EamA family transporter [Rhabdochlamydiaceae bacterium]
MGLLFCFASAVSFGLLACVSKVAERRKCDASALVASLLGWATLLMLLRSVTLQSKTHLPLKAVPIAIVFGICGAVAYFAFQSSIEVGKVTVGWLMMNLSAGVPAVVSIWMYNEKLTALKVLAFSLAIISVLLLFWGQKMEQRQVKEIEQGRR